MGTKIRFLATGMIIASAALMSACDMMHMFGSSDDEYESPAYTPHSRIHSTKKSQVAPVSAMPSSNDPNNPNNSMMPTPATGSTAAPGTMNPPASTMPGSPPATTAPTPPTSEAAPLLPEPKVADAPITKSQGSGAAPAPIVTQQNPNNPPAKTDSDDEATF